MYSENAVAQKNTAKSNTHKSLGSGWNQKGYEAWKETKLNEWKDSEKQTGSWSNSLLGLYKKIDESMEEELRFTPYSESWKRSILETIKETAASFIKPWKDEFDLREKIISAPHLKDLYKFYNLIQITERPSILEKTRQLWATKDRLYAYNFLRELSGKPLSLEIDEQWIKNLKKDLQDLTGIEFVSPMGISKWTRPKLLAPTTTQQELLKEARIMTDILDSRLLITPQKGRGSSCSNLTITIELNDNLHAMLFSIYHELGHIKNGDTDVFAFQGETPNTTIKTVDAFETAFPKTSAYTKKINEYVARARKEITNKSETGKILLQKSKQTKELFIPPSYLESFVRGAIMRAREMQADLFAIKELLQQKKYDTIMSKIWDYATSKNPSTIDGTSPDAFNMSYLAHPSDLERALYIVGFLFSEGIDVNTLLYDSENHGVCPNISKLYGPWSHLHQ
jgi:hypothetical protein